MASLTITAMQGMKEGKTMLDAESDTFFELGASCLGLSPQVLIRPSDQTLLQLCDKLSLVVVGLQLRLEGAVIGRRRC